MKIGEDGDGRARWITPDDRARGRQFREVYLLRGSRRLGRPSCRTSRRHLRDRRFAFLLETSFRRTTEQHVRIHLEQIGRAHVCTPVTNAHIVCRLLLEKKKKKQNNIKNMNPQNKHTRRECTTPT